MLYLQSSAGQKQIFECQKSGAQHNLTVEDVRKFFSEKVFSTIIPRLVKLVEAPSHGKPILEYDPKSKGALAYLNLAKEVIERNGN